LSQDHHHGHNFSLEEGDFEVPRDRDLVVKDNITGCHEPSVSVCRFGIGRFTTLEEVEYTAERIIYHVKRLREMR